MPVTRLGSLVAGAVLVAVPIASAKPVPSADPLEIASSGGVLDGTLTAASATVDVAGKTVTTTVYNGAYMPPLLRVQPGDVVRLHLANASAFDTNVHYHGLAVTPLGARPQGMMANIEVVAPGAAPVQPR